MAGQIIQTIKFIIHLLILEISLAHRLNVPRVLLPVFNDFAINFTLEVTDGGCYQWSTSRNDIVQLVSLDRNVNTKCSSTIVVQVVTREPIRNTAIILAEEIHNGQFLRCDVIVDAIFSLNLVTTTRELYIEEAPEAFEVRAYDEQGNEFTTLAGVEFAWSISDRDSLGAQLNAESNSILRFISYHDSQYETPSTVAVLDLQKKKGHIILLEGIKTGTAKVSAKLPHSEYKHIPSIEVELIVIANLIIIPSDITIMALDSFKYKIMQASQGRLEEINLISSQYYLEAEKADILQIDNERGQVYATAIGKSKVFLHDGNVRDEYSVILPSATVNVNALSYISITVQPSKNGQLVLDENHEIIVELFDAKDHKFHVGEGVEVSLEIDQRFLESKFISQNGTYMIGVPKQCGTTIVVARLFGIIDINGNEIPLTSQLSAKAELEIQTRVTVEPLSLAVPWDPLVPSSLFNITLKANGGGGGPYFWTSQQPSSIGVSQIGHLQIMKQGLTEILVSSMKNPSNKAVSKIYVLPVTKLKIIEYTLEAPVGEAIYVHLALYGTVPSNEQDNNTNILAFSQCENLNFEIHIPNGHFVESANDRVLPVGIACTVIKLISLSTGTSKVTIAYKTEGGYLSDNITISAYEALTVKHPNNEETILAVGSSRKIVFQGGPNPWTDKQLHSYSREIKTSEDGLIEIHDDKEQRGNLTVFNVICKKLGQVRLTYTVSNVPVLSSCKSTKTESSVTIICGKPRYINLQGRFDNPSCLKMMGAEERITANRHKNLKIQVTLKDEDGRVFDNFTSLNIEWILKPNNDVGVLESNVGVLEETYNDLGIILPNGHYQNILFQKNINDLMLCCKVVGYQKSILGKLKITPEWPVFLLDNSIVETCRKIYLVNDTKIVPERLTILNDPLGKYYLQLSQGSGYYDIALSSNDIAQVQYLETSKVISIIPKESGTLRITLSDLCINSKPTEAVIEIQQLASIEIESVNKVEKGKCITAGLKLYDSNGRLIKLPSLDILNLEVLLDNSCIQVTKLETEGGGPPYDKILFNIKGLEEGESLLTFVNKRDNNEIRNEAIVIQVFLPLKINPKNLTLLMGSVYQLSTEGGPSNAEIEFIVDNNDILSIDSNGIVRGKMSIGRTNVIARAIGYHSKGNKIIYSEDKADIYLVHLEGIKILAPSTRIKVGGIIPLWAFAIPDDLNPLVIGSMKWSSSDDEILNLYNMYKDTGINIRKQNEISIRGKANRAGIVTVYLNATIPNSSKTYTTFIKIEIIQQLELMDVGSSCKVSVVSMSPQTSFKLKTNRDGFGSNIYKVSNSTEEGLITIDDKGVIRANDLIGKSILTINHVEGFHLKQSLIVVVEVKPIHYFMITFNTKLRIKNGEELDGLPKGMNFNYALEYFDNFGMRFHAAKISYKIMTSRQDLASFNVVRIDNSIDVKFHQTGQLLMKIYHEKYPNGMFDYVDLVIGNLLFPTKTILTLGDIVCFSMPLFSQDGDPGYWQSSATDVLTIDSITGIGRAKNIGYSVVKHNLAQDGIQVTVEEISNIFIVPSRGKNITGSQVFSVPLVLGNKEDENKVNNILTRGEGGCRTYTSFVLGSFPYTCSVEFASSTSYVETKDLFFVEPRFDITTGFYYCDVIPMGSPNKISSTLETGLVITAQSRTVRSSSLEIPYLPPVFVEDKEILLINSYSSKTFCSNLQVYGLPIVLGYVNIDVPDGLTVSNGRYISSTIISYKLCVVKNENEIQGRKVVVTNQLTKQNISLYIRISKYDDTSAPLSGVVLLDYLYYHRYTFLTFGILLISFCYMWKNKVTNVDLNIKNKSIFCASSRDTTPCVPVTPTMNTSLPSPTTLLQPFSAFEPVYGDPRGYYTPSAKRNRTLNSS